MTHTSQSFKNSEKCTSFLSLFFLSLLPLFIISLFIFNLTLKVPRKLGKIGCVMACARTGILPTLACNAANKHWGVASMSWRERRGGRHEVGIGASSWDARLEHGGTIWQGTSSIFSRIIMALLSPLPSTKYMSMPSWGAEYRCTPFQPIPCQRHHLARTYRSGLDVYRLVKNLSCLCP